MCRSDHRPVRAGTAQLVKTLALNITSLLATSRTATRNLCAASPRSPSQARAGVPSLSLSLLSRTSSLPPPCLSLSLPCGSMRTSSAFLLRIMLRAPLTCAPHTYTPWLHDRPNILYSLPSVVFTCGPALHTRIEHHPTKARIFSPSTFTGVDCIYLRTRAAHANRTSSHEGQDILSFYLYWC